MITNVRRLLTLASLWAAASAAPAYAERALPDTMTFHPAYGWVDSAGHEPRIDHSGSVAVSDDGEAEWLSAPFGDVLLMHPDPWRERHSRRVHDIHMDFDYNRVDLVRPGLHYQAQAPQTMLPRLGARLEYATGRNRLLYGLQVEQPLLPTARFVLGVSMVRRTDHSELQQVDDLENSLALLFAREDLRDYFEREGAGAYLSWRVPDFSTVSLHGRRDRFGSLEANPNVRSWFRLQHPLRPNPQVDDGVTHSASVRLERLARNSRAMRAGLYHWIELERAGGALGGDFRYTRALADLRSVLRLSPGSTLSVRAVCGSKSEGTLPRQKQFTAGGVDGLRAHAIGARRGDQLALGQAEYMVGLWPLAAAGMNLDLQAIAFVDAGTAWSNRDGRWDAGRQHFALDGGFGIATSEDDARIYFARDLKDPHARFVVSFRLRRPF